MQHSLPPMVHEFEINVVGEETGERYKGTFQYKRPNIGLRRQIKIYEDQLNNGSETLDANIRALNLIVSHLHFTLIEYPKWWNGAVDMYDENVLVEIYKEVLNFEESFRKKIEDQSKKDEKEDKE